MSTFMIGFYVHKSFSLNIGGLETFQINNQTILNCVNLWSKEVPYNISYPSIVKPNGGYLDEIIIPSSVRYIITRNK